MAIDELDKVLNTPPERHVVGVDEIWIRYGMTFSRISWELVLLFVPVRFRERIKCARRNSGGS